MNPPIPPFPRLLFPLAFLRATEAFFDFLIFDFAFLAFFDMIIFRYFRYFLLLTQ